MAYLKDHSSNDTTLRRLDQLVRNLGSARFTEREQAVETIVSLGPAALPRLHLASRSPDKEIARRAKSCIQQIAKDWDPQLPRVVVRRVIKNWPEGSASALLRHLPYVADEELVEEVWYALDALAVQQCRLDPVFEAALQDEFPARRALAAYLLGRRGDAGQRAKVKKLLADPNAEVRLRAAQGLLGSKEKDSIPTIIALLDQPSVALAWQAEELLHYVAGADAPQSTIGAGTPQSRQACRKAWEAWWDAHGSKLDLAVLDAQPRRPGLVLLNRGGVSRESFLMLCGCDGKPRWELRLSPAVTDAHLLFGDRLLVAQTGRSRRPAEKGEGSGISERNLEGKILWHYRGSGSASCRRQPNGNTVFFDSRGVEVLGPEGGRVLARPMKHGRLRPISPIASNLHIVCVGSEPGVVGYVEVDLSTGDIVHRLPFHYLPRGTKLLPNGHYLTGTGVEVDRAGEVVWRYPHTASLSADEKRLLALLDEIVWPCPRDAARLPTGNTLISWEEKGSGGRAAEIDPAGKMVWEAYCEAVPRLHPCFNLLRLGFDSPRPADFNLSRAETRLKGLSANDPKVRLMSVVALAKLGPEAKEVVPALINALTDKTPEVRLASVVALAKFGPKAEEAVPALIEALADPDKQVRVKAEEALQAVGRPASPRVVEALKDKRPTVRAHAITLVGSFHVNGHLHLEEKLVVPHVLTALKDEDVFVRYRAVWAAGCFKSHAKEIVPALAAALKDREAFTDYYNRDRQACVAEMAFSVLRSFGPAARDAIPALIEAGKSGDKEIERIAVGVLGAVGGKDERAIQTLREILKDKKRMDLRSAAAGGLGLLGPEARSAVPDLLEALQVKDVKDPATADSIRTAVIFALGKIGPEAKGAVPALLAILEDRRMYFGVRLRAAEALGSIGPAAAPAIPLLQEVARDKERECPQVYQAATNALEKIRR